MKDIVIKDAKADMTLPPDLTEKRLRPGTSQSTGLYRLTSSL